MRWALIVFSFLMSTAWADEPRFQVGSSNPDLYAGAQALYAGRHEKGIRLTLKGLEAATDRRQEETALSNLCAGYTNMGDYETALKYCEILLQRNDRLWRPYNSLALIYIDTKQYDKAQEALEKAEAINPGASTVKIARALYLGIDSRKNIEP